MSRARSLHLAVLFGLMPLPALAVDAAVPPVPPPSGTMVVPAHLTDEQDRVIAPQLDPAAEALEKANVLYAQSVLQGSPDDPRGTLDLLQQVAALDPHFTGIQIKIANLLMQLGQADAAFSGLQDALAANPGSVGIQAALGYLHHLRGESAEALRLCNIALARDPTQSVCMRVLLENASEQNDLAGGMLHIEDILKVSPSPVPASSWITLAKLYIELARSDLHPPSGGTILNTLLPIYQEASDGNPPDLGALLLLSDTYRDLGRKQDALRTLRQASKLDPTDADLVVRCGDIEATLGLKNNALRDYEAAYAIDPNLAGLREILGRFYLEDHRFNDAVRLLEAALAASPDDASLLVELGIAYDAIHLHDKAQECFARVFDSPSCPPEAYLKLAAFQLGNQQVPKAIATLAVAGTHFPRSVRILFYRAIAERYAKHYDTALVMLKAMRHFSSEPDAPAFDINYYLETALDLSLSKKKKDVEAVLREGLLNHPDNSDLLNELAYFWADENKNLNDAYTYSHRAAVLDPENGAIQDTCGWVEYRRGHFRDALPYLQRGAVMTNNDAVVLQHLGDTYLRLGHPLQAVAAWRLALKKDPENHDLQSRIDALPAQAQHVEPRYAPNL